MSVIKIKIGQSEQFVPSAFSPEPLCEVIEAEATSQRAAFYSTEEISKNHGLPVLEADVSHRGLRLAMPMKHASGVYGLGLQLKSFQHRGSKKVMRVNADPRSTSGDSHAPVPFFVTTDGYGLYLDTARDVSFHFSRQMKDAGKAENSAPQQVMTDTAELYAVRESLADTFMVAEIPYAQGVDAYFITGDTILDIVSQYNLLSGGGCMPPMWGLGGFYRCYSRFNDAEVLRQADDIRRQQIPCDVLGLEPGWQTHTYSCSYLWDPIRFPKPQETVRKLNEAGYHVNLWEHAFIHPTSPLREPMKPYAGDQLVWEGLVPDFTLPEARDTFAGYQATLTESGVTGFKLDECDSSDYTGGWSFPDCSRFPSGVEGDQYHHLFGTLYAQTMMKALCGKRTLSEVRNMGGLAASYPFVLYSDLYEQSDFLMGVVNAGFSGLLWSPQVREAKNAEELLRRLQLVIFSHMAQVNAWYLEKAPWEVLGCTDAVRELFDWRMRLIPYLYTAFYDYHRTGRPPIRALVCEHQQEKEAWDCADEFMFGDSILVAPILYPNRERTVYLPEGEWYDLFTHEKFTGGTHVRQTDGIPVYVKSGTILPLAEPVLHMDSSKPLNITLTAFGDCEGSSCRLIEDDGDMLNTEYRQLEYTLNREPTESRRYHIIGSCQVR